MLFGWVDDAGCAVDFNGLQGLRVVFVARAVEAAQVIGGLGGEEGWLDGAVLVEGCLGVVSAHRHYVFVI